MTAASGKAPSGAVPVEQLRAAIRLLWPGEITPTARRLLTQLCDQHTHEPADDEEPPGTPCAWCGRAIELAPGGVTWLAVKAAERDYDPNHCYASDDGFHEPDETP